MKAAPALRSVHREGGPAAPAWTNIWLILGVALLLRLGWAALVPIDPVSDSVLYDGFAKNIAFGKGYAFPGGDLTVYWPVGAPAVYAVIYAVFGSGGWATAVFQALLGALIVALTWRLALRYSGTRSAGLAGWLVALWPLLIQFTTILASELLFVALILAALDVWGNTRIRPFLRALGWGALIAAATYVRPTAWPLLFIFPMCGWLVDRQWRTSTMTLGVSVVIASLLFAPWVYRNYQLFDRFVLVAANGGVNLWMGNNPESNGGYMQLPERAFANEVERDRFYGAEAVAFIKANPLQYLKLSIRRALMTYDRETIGVAWNETGILRRFGPGALQPLKLVSTAYWLPMLLIGTWGIWRTWRAGQIHHVWPLFAALVFFCAVPVLTVAQDRYHVPIDPLLALFVSWGVFGFSGRVGSARGMSRHG